MLDARLRKIIDPPLDRLGRRLAHLGVTANSVTWTGFFVGMGAWALLALESYPLALTCILLNRLADGLDGAVARHGRISDLGGYLDIVLDFLFYSGVAFFFAVGRPEQALPAAFLIFRRHRGLLPRLRRPGRQARHHHGGARHQVDLLPGRPDGRHGDHRPLRRHLSLPRPLRLVRLDLRRSLLADHRGAHLHGDGDVQALGV